MNEYRLLIVDSDAAYANKTAGYLSENTGFKIAGIASDGATALKMLTTSKIDVVLLDPMLPGMDGISLINAVQTQPQVPLFICISEAYTSIGIELARRSGVGYYFYKPIEMKFLASVLIQCCHIAQERKTVQTTQSEINRSNDSASKIHSLLHDLGFSAKMNGRSYIFKAVELAMESPASLNNLSGGIYQKISDMLHVSPASIERSIRTAITAANSDGKLTEKIGSVPTNKTLFRYLINTLKLQP